MTDLILWAWFEVYIVHILFFPNRYRDHSKGGHVRFKLRAKRCDRSCNQLLTQELVLICSVGATKKGRN